MSYEDDDDNDVGQIDCENWEGSNNDEQEDQGPQLLQTTSNDLANTQYPMSQLEKCIEKEVNHISMLTGLPRQWSFIYFQICGWRVTLCEKYIGLQKTPQLMINFIPEAITKVQPIKDQCIICCSEQNPILKNLCGHYCCQNCWKDHITSRLKQYYREPLPPCIQENCPVLVSPALCEYLKSKNSQFSKLYQTTLCRGYAMGNRSIKICKGRPGLSCNQVFSVKSFQNAIECKSCGSFVCPCCGEQLHTPAECYDRNNWRKVVQQSVSYMEILNYRSCPFCKAPVQKKTGCNSVVCLCKQTFCFICGEKWLPNHRTHGQCYRQKEIKALELQKKKKIQNQKNYYNRIQQLKAQLQPIQRIIKQIRMIKVEDIKKNLCKQFLIFDNKLSFLDDLCSNMLKAALFYENSLISLYFVEKNILKAQIQYIWNNLLLLYNFFQNLVAIPKIFQNKEGLTKKQFDLKSYIGSPEEFIQSQKINMVRIDKDNLRYMS